jgi:hypothetical protein
MVLEDRFARSDKTSIASPASADLLEGDGHRGMRQKQARWQPAGFRKSGATCSDRYATEQVNYKDNEQDSAEDPKAAAGAPPGIAVVSTTTTEQQHENND